MNPWQNVEAKMPDLAHKDKLLSIFVRIDRPSLAGKVYTTVYIQKITDGVQLAYAICQYSIV